MTFDAGAVAAAWKALEDDGRRAHWLAHQALVVERWADGWAAWAQALAPEAAALAAWLPEVPRWDGTPLDGRQLSVWPHPYGFGDGDWLLFARYLPLLSGGTVLIVAPERLARLFGSYAPGARCVRPEDAAATDARCLVTELPLLIPGMAGPPPSSPYVGPDPADVERWRGTLQLRPGVLNVGVCWQPGEPRDGLPLSFRRGIPGRSLVPLLETPGIRWIGLQRGEPARDSTPHRLGVLRVGPRLADYADTAAVVSLLDLTIGVDTSVSNLCGAMGAPCWVMLPTASDWRWGRGETSAWYPSARLFRQQRPGDWTPVIAEVADALRERVKRHRW